MPTKLIVTNRKRLRSKYGNTGLNTIEDRLRKLIDADGKRGITTDWVAMDIQSHVGPKSAPKITNAGDPRQTKACVDALFAGTRPDYLMILGAPDVVCHQPLLNPIIGDEDDEVPSDLPYACDEAFSDEISDFTGPGRVVGRLPDVAGASDPAALLAALDTATDYQRRSTAAYKSYCAISTDSWKLSTQKSVRNIFGRTTLQHIAPPAGPPWSKVELKPRVHLINCHGLDFDPAFYGDDGNGGQPLVIDQRDYEGRLRDGAVIAAECCYGSMLYDGQLFQIPRGICNTAMSNGCYAFVGSTNVAYGPSDSNDYADLVCRYFLQNVRNGASSGRALLEARQRYVSATAPLDPVDLKTIAQFCLLGDPSIHPVNIPEETRRSMARSAARSTTAARRKTLHGKGRRIGSSVAHVYSKMDRTISPGMRASLSEIIPAARYRSTSDVLSFRVHTARKQPLANSKTAAKKAAAVGCYHVIGAFDTSRQSTLERGPDILLIAFEENNVIRSVKKVYRR